MIGLQFKNKHFPESDTIMYTIIIIALQNHVTVVLLAVSYKCDTHGSFILMNTLQVKNDTNTHTKPRNSRRNLLSLDMPTAFDLSKIMNPSPPIENRKLDARPSMMYWPFTR